MISIADKTCTKCGQPKPATLEYFKPHKQNGAEALHPWCKACWNANRRNRRQSRGEEYLKRQRALRTAEYYQRNAVAIRDQQLRFKYGITLEQYDQMRVAQNDRCEICKQLPPPDEILNVDHDHGTGKVRALLCGPCNRLLGQACDSIPTLLAAVEYLRRFSE